MVILVRFHVLSEGRKGPVRTRYFPDWRSERKPELNGAQVELPMGVEVPPGGDSFALLRPLRAELWVLEPGDVLRGYEGFKQTCEGEVLAVFDVV